MVAAVEVDVLAFANWFMLAYCAWANCARNCCRASASCCCSVVLVEVVEADASLLDELDALAVVAAVVLVVAPLDA